MTRHRQIAVAVALVVFSTTASALRSVKSEAYTDPDFKGYLFSKAVVLVNNASNDMKGVIEERMTEAMKKHGIELVTYRSLFPPTRDWTEDQRVAILAREQVKAALIVTIGQSASSVIPVATQTFSRTTIEGTATATGNTARFNGTANTKATSYNIVAAKSSADFSAVLIDAETGRTAWYADITTKARGTLFVGEKGDAKAVVKGIMDGLQEQSHLPKK